MNILLAFALIPRAAAGQSPQPLAALVRKIAPSIVPSLPEAPAAPRSLPAGTSNGRPRPALNYMSASGNISGSGFVPCYPPYGAGYRSGSIWLSGYADVTGPEGLRGSVYVSGSVFLSG